ncbi:hypothetical protein [Roseobacter sp. MED193]|uniref:hypothetical protein n=1 Tax=Roseobacter sp. MED193 TaxID=314262 RepID=UPI0020C7E609|nr:hypothetical protein [Roseobacter sp. MED193]
MITLITKELDWFSDPLERVLGTLVWDRVDGDYSWAVFARDAVKKFRAIQANTSYSTSQEAYNALMAAMVENSRKPDEAFHQNDEDGPAVDFFTPAVDEARFHPSFQILLEDQRYSPAREIIEAMMRYHEDVDGNFVQKFQTAGWDALLWELYLYATFNELRFIRVGTGPTPDFVLRGNEGGLAVEATSVNPSNVGPNDVPEDSEAFKAYLENYVPIRLSNALRSKLNHKPPYWKQEGAEDVPFCIAVQDYHLQGSMRYLTSAATEYVFGVRHWMDSGEHKIARIGTHRYGKKRAQSGFFDLKGAENVSAVIINPQGTLTKFNRLGIAAGFGDPRVKMVRMGMKRNDTNSQAPFPTPFEEEVGPQSSETWVEGMVVLHNPNARIPLDPDIIPGAAHEFLQRDGSIMSLLPDFHPFVSQSIVTIEDDEKNGTD